MAARIREARAMEERACLRWLTYCEQQLQTHPLTPPVMDGGSLPSRAKRTFIGLPFGHPCPMRGGVSPTPTVGKDLEGSGPSSSTGEREEGLLLALERGLYDRQDIAYRAGGTLLRRWQHCLAEVTMRLMKQYKLST